MNSLLFASKSSTRTLAVALDLEPIIVSPATNLPADDSKTTFNSV